MATDPVCGMTVDEKEAAAKVEYLGHTNESVEKPQNQNF